MELTRSASLSFTGVQARVFFSLQIMETQKGATGILVHQLNLAGEGLNPVTDPSEQRSNTADDFILTILQHRKSLRGFTDASACL